MSKVWFPPHLDRMLSRLHGIAWRRESDRNGQRIIIPLTADAHLLVRRPETEDYLYELCHVRELRPGTLPLVERIAQVHNEDALAFLIRQVIAEGGKTPGMMHW